MLWCFLAVLIVLIASCVCFFYILRRRSMDRWIVPYLMHVGKRRWRRFGEPTHLLLCIADHYEPCLGKPGTEVAQARANRWLKEYPERLGRFRDSDGRPPRHTFFYPIEEYVPAHVDAIARLCRAGYGEIEVHLHHDSDTPENLRNTLVEYRELLARQYGMLSRHKTTGELAYGFIHGNWALNNSRPDGRWCGVNNETEVLRATGCYADFTLPSAPSPTQTKKINSIYRACSSPDRPKCHDAGIDVGRGPAPSNSLLLIQGPLLLNWQQRKFGLVPRVENACLQANHPPTAERLSLWLKARIHVPSRPDWFFVKLHTHGANEENADMILGQPMQRFHQHLADLAHTDPGFQFHYVSAREMYNLVRAAESGWQGPIAEALDFELVWNARRLAY